MTKEEIGKKIKGYYKWKLVIVMGLIICLIFTVIPVIVGSILAAFPTVDHILPNNLRLSAVLSAVGLVAYIILWGFIIVAVFFPLGKYSLENSIQKRDLKPLLEYIINLDCGYNEQYDSLMVIGRTAEGMVSQIVGWDKQDYEGCLNQAWNLLNRYFQNRVISKIDFANFKRYAEEILHQLDSEQINPNKLEDIINGKYEVSSLVKEHPIPKRSKLFTDYRIQLMATIALVLIIVFKLLQQLLQNYLPPAVLDNIIVNLLLGIGPDCISVVFAVFAVKSCSPNSSNT